MSVFVKPSKNDVDVPGKYHQSSFYSASGCDHIFPLRISETAFHPDDNEYDN